jgi:hypothetical protein
MMSFDPGRAATLQQKVGETYGPRKSPPTQPEGEEKHLIRNNLIPLIEIS